MASSLKALQEGHGGALSVHHAGEDRRLSFLMTTGIECSCPTVEGGRRRDELEETGHYSRWREDFELCRWIGARFVRYGLPYYRMHLGPGRYDWSFADEVLPGLWDAGLAPIVDLCHFGVPDWVGSFQNPDWPPLFAEYAAAFAARYPWVKLYTPVNEMLVCARFSALYGCWNEQEKSERAMVTAHSVQCRATLLAMDEILARRPDAVFIQSEIAECFLEQWPQTAEAVAFRNRHRFITFDFLYGHPPEADVLNFLYDHGMSRQDYEWFMRQGRHAAGHCVMGMDYYGDNEKVVEPDGSDRAMGVMLGWGSIALEYFQRYRRPMMLTETNSIDDGHGRSCDWLHRTWHQARFLRHSGLPVIGYTWYSLTDQIDWDIQIREVRGNIVPNGLVTLDRQPRDVAHAYKQLAEDFGDSALNRAAPRGFETMF
jgi:beta-glucosidase/6-phospho-beta-glucosidase/beta-galactosidase